MPTRETLEEIARIERCDDNPYFEIVDSRIVMQPLKSVYDCMLASRLSYLLGADEEVSKRGWVIMRALFELRRNAELWRRPEVAFVSYVRWPRHRPMSSKAIAWDVIPNLAVEIIHSEDKVGTLEQKLDEYFRAGVELVWVFYPDQAMVYVYESLTQVRGLTIHDTLDGGKVLPQFRLPLKDLFTS